MYKPLNRTFNVTTCLSYICTNPWSFVHVFTKLKHTSVFWSTLFFQGILCFYSFAFSSTLKPVLLSPFVPKETLDSFRCVPWKDTGWPRCRFTCAFMVSTSLPGKQILCFNFPKETSSLLSPQHTIKEKLLHPTTDFMHCLYNLQMKENWTEKALPSKVSSVKRIKLTRTAAYSKYLQHLLNFHRF